MVEELEKKKTELRNARGVHKGSVTKLEKWIDAEEPDRDEHEVDARIDLLDVFFRQFCAVQDQLEALDQKELAEREEMEKRVVTAKAKLKRLRFKLSSESQAFVVFQDASGGASTATPVQVEVCQPAEVPLPQVPKFSGDDYLEYPNFINTFKTLVGARQTRGFTNVKKFTILRNALEGRALESVKHLLLTTDNYDVALKILDDRFRKPRLNFESLIKKLLHVPKVTGASSLRKMLDAVNAHLKALEGIPATPEQIGYGILIHHILKHVDDVTLNKWEEESCKIPDQLPDWAELSKFLDNRANMLESMAYLQSDRKEKPPSQQTKKTYASMQVSCVSCNGSCTSLPNCTKFQKKTPKERYAWVKANQHCVRCLFNTPHTTRREVRP